jgi:hypothetical protein
MESVELVRMVCLIHIAFTFEAVVLMTKEAHHFLDRKHTHDTNTNKHTHTGKM